jgi:glycosyltransferase involved in cell wall biosynthesis
MTGPTSGPTPAGSSSDAAERSVDDDRPHPRRALLQVIASTDRRGAEVFALQLAAAMRDRSWSVRSVALAPGTQADGLDVETLAGRRRSVRGLRSLRAASRRVDLVIAHGSTTLPACALALMGTGTPFVYRNIGDPSAWGTGRRRRLQSRLCLRRASAVVALGAAAADEITSRYHVPRAEIVAIPKGVPARRFRPADPEVRASARQDLGLPDGRSTIAVIGALSPEKQVEVAIDAVARIPDARLIVVGDGPARSGLERRARRALGDRCSFTGAVADPSPIYAACDVVVATSRTEGLPGVLIEAGLCGLPVVASDVGYVREIVDPGRTGILVPAGDVAATASALAWAIREGAVLGAAARRRCLARFSLDEVASLWDELLLSLLDARRVGVVSAAGAHHATGAGR